MVGRQQGLEGLIKAEDSLIEIRIIAPGSSDTTA
jgi:hypothetical protein